MRFYTENRKYYCGIDLHTKEMYVCILNQAGEILVHQNIPAKPGPFLKLIADYRDELVVGVECIFSWYWLADLCDEEGIEFILGHALYMKAIHGGKTKNGKLDSEKIARLMRGGNFPLAYVYPAELRPYRDLLRRRNFLVNMRSEVLAHIKLTNHQYNLPVFEKHIGKKGNREGLAERFTDATVRKNVEVDLAVADQMHEQINALENYIIRHVKQFDPRMYFRLQSVPGIGKILALIILYEVGDLSRFPTVQSFCSYSRLVKCPKESAGKKAGSGGGKIGNAHLKWAFGEATALFMRESARAKAFVAKHEKKHGKGKAMSILAHKLGRAIYFMWKRNDAFDEKYFFKT